MVGCRSLCAGFVMALWAFSPLALHRNKISHNFVLWSAVLRSGGQPGAPSPSLTVNGGGGRMCAFCVNVRCWASPLIPAAERDPPRPAGCGALLCLGLEERTPPPPAPQHLRAPPSGVCNLPAPARLKKEHNGASLPAFLERSLGNLLPFEYCFLREALRRGEQHLEVRRGLYLTASES